jgi:hypothetical protein
MTKFRSLLAVSILALSASALASSLGDYKNQSMGQHKEVTSESCPEDYKKDCKSKCAPGDGGCFANCDNTAEQFCKERDSRRTKKEWELAAKGASLGAGAAAMLFDDKMGTVSPNGTIPVSPYAQYWNRASVFAQLGLGALQGGTYLGTGSFQFRDSALGFAANLDYMWDGTDQLAELDLGPTINFGTAHLITGFQPSLLIHSANGFAPVFGGGLRALTTYYLDQLFVQFNPLLGYSNSQWNYDIIMAIGYRFTPNFSVDIGYSHRDVLDLNDLNISETGLNGAFLRLGIRMN